MVKEDFALEGEYEFKQPTRAEIDDHLVDWSRLRVDNGHLWRFPKTNLCEHRLTTDEIEEALPDADTLLYHWRNNTIDLLIPDYLAGIRRIVPSKDCGGDIILAS